ncbi:hypothetical protein ACH5RR_012918 [Cinchona calisaya]|uniref:Transposase n=1 Tax=Cinchona calisaya TaxID=153742 RepID=A0ABD3ABS6_9GENT
MRKRTSSEVGISQINFGEIEKKYVGGCLDYFDDCNPIDMKLSVLIHMTNGLGYRTNVGFMYKIPVVNGDIQNSSGEIAEGDNEDSKGDFGSFDGEEFHDSDYDFCKDDDNMIYNQSVATAGRDLSIVLGIKEVGHEEQGIEEPEQHEPHEPGQKHKHVKATAACDVNIFHGEQIQVNEESEFLNSDELNSIYSSSDEEVRPTSRHKVYKTLQKAKILIYGKYKKQYSKIWDYHEELLKRNPGSTMDTVTAVDEISGKERFQRMYICFEALKRGFRERCRPVVGVDGCPILGLGSAIHEILPRIEDRHCVRHLHNNFKKLHPSDSLKARV